MRWYLLDIVCDMTLQYFALVLLLSAAWGIWKNPISPGFTSVIPWWPVWVSGPRFGGHETLRVENCCSLNGFFKGVYSYTVNRFFIMFLKLHCVHSIGFFTMFYSLIKLYLHENNIHIWSSFCWIYFLNSNHQGKEQGIQSKRFVAWMIPNFLNRASKPYGVASLQELIINIKLEMDYTRPR